MGWWAHRHLVSLLPRQRGPRGPTATPWLTSSMSSREPPVRGARTPASLLCRSLAPGDRAVARQWGQIQCPLAPRGPAGVGAAVLLFPAGPWSQCPLSLLCSAQPPGAGSPRSLPQPVPSSSVPRLASPGLLALALCCWLPGFWDLRCRLQLWTCSGPWPAPQAGSRIANSARPSPGQPFPHLPHTWASAPGVSLDRPRPPHRVTSKLPAMASRAGRGCVSRCTLISPRPAARPRSSQGDSASVQATSSSP